MKSQSGAARNGLEGVMTPEQVRGRVHAMSISDRSVAAVRRRIWYYSALTELEWLHMRLGRRRVSPLTAPTYGSRVSRSGHGGALHD